MFKWITITEGYLDYLRKNGDHRIPYSNYGNDKFKPFFGVLFTKGDYAYVTQVSHPQPRHFKMTESVDFKKIYMPTKPDKLLCVVNLNYMFPVPIKEMIDVHYFEIEKYRSFSSKSEKSRYVFLLRKEMQSIESTNIIEEAKKIYTNKYAFPDNPLSQRSLDYKELEKVAQKWLSEKGKD